MNSSTHGPVHSPDLYLGLISGTSMDGIDAALVDLSNAQPKLLGADSFPYPATLRSQVAAACQGQLLDAGALSALDVQIGGAFATASMALLKNLDVDPDTVCALGSHGQNVFHGPTGRPSSTLQLGDPHVIASQTGITTVADFRRRDVALGGQGAPLAPALHQQLFRSSQESRAVLNLGGIGNLTLLPANPEKPVCGFDTGPGNCLMDDWILKKLANPFDAEGRWAETGTANPKIFARLIADPYFAKAGPKSTGREYFNLSWVEQSVDVNSIDPADLQATLAQLTVETVTTQLQQTLPDCARLLVCGGGARNTALMQRLRHSAGSALNLSVELTDEYGVSAEWVEAVLFASLAKSAVRALPTDLQAVTGAPPHIYGVVFPA